MKHRIHSRSKVTVGLDIGDKFSVFYSIDADGELLSEGRLKTTPEALEKHFGSMEPARIAIETSGHSPWLSRLLESLGHEVLVANSRELRMIYGSHKKNDKADAEALARVARADPKLLKPIQHRGPEAQQSLAVLRARDTLVRARTKFINHVRGAVKSVGGRVAGCGAKYFHQKAPEFIPDCLQAVMSPILKLIGELTAQIRAYDKEVENLCDKKYPETELVRQVAGVGPLTALAYVLVLEDPRRFVKSRNVGAYLGLTPRLDDSGGRESQLRISKAGDNFVRRLLVGSAQYVLGPFGPDTDLRRHGEAIALRGGKKAKKRAVVAVARKLSVILHRLWKTGEVYDPLRNACRKDKRREAAAS